MSLKKTSFLPKCSLWNLETHRVKSFFFTSIRYLCIRWRVLTFVICIIQLYSEKTQRCANIIYLQKKWKRRGILFFSFSVQVVCVFCKPLWGNLLVTRETYSLLFTLQWKVLLWPVNLLGMFTTQQVSENIPFSHLFLTLVKIFFDCCVIATYKHKIPRKRSIFACVCVSACVFLKNLFNLQFCFVLMSHCREYPELTSFISEGIITMIREPCLVWLKDDLWRTLKPTTAYLQKHVLHILTVSFSNRFLFSSWNFN